jgi:hypothetical protein
MQIEDILSAEELTLIVEATPEVQKILGEKTIDEVGSKLLDDFGLSAKTVTYTEILRGTYVLGLKKMDTHMTEMGRDGWRVVQNHMQAAGARPGVKRPGSMIVTYVKEHARTRYWGNLKEEFRIFVCTSDRKYADLRKKVESSATKSQVTLTSTIAVAFSTHLGIAAGLLVPACALCLIALVKMGREAFCKMHLDITVR